MILLPGRLGEPLLYHMQKHGLPACAHWSGGAVSGIARSQARAPLLTLLALSPQSSFHSLPHDGPGLHQVHHGDRELSSSSLSLFARLTEHLSLADPRPHRCPQHRAVHLLLDCQVLFRRHHLHDHCRHLHPVVLGLPEADPPCQASPSGRHGHLEAPQVGLCHLRHRAPHPDCHQCLVCLHGRGDLRLSTAASSWSSSTY